MSGFFTLKETESAKVVGRSQTCASCGLYCHAQHPKMEPSGNFQKEILIVTSAPNATDDRTGRYWSGGTGQFLKKTMAEWGFSLQESTLTTGSAQCTPLTEKGAYRTPNSHEIACCRSKLQTIIKQRKPKVIILLGEAALESVIGNEWKNNLGGINKWRGWTIPDQKLKAWVCPTYSPSFVKEADTQFLTAWKADLKQALGMADVPFPDMGTPEKHVKILHDRKEIRNTLQGILDGPFPPDPALAAFDYETTGLKPHAEGHKIISASICAEPDQAYSFMMPYTSKSCMRLWKEIMETSRMGKMAHNMKYEMTFTEKILGYPVKNWAWDSMQAAHILNNREGITSLKFQVYVNFGIEDYGSEVHPYLESGDKNANAFNRIEELISTDAGKQKLLLYGGLDSLYEYWLAIKQMGVMGCV